MSESDDLIWATKRVQQDEVRPIEGLFRDQAASLDPSGQMLLVAVDERLMVRLWVTLPDYDLLQTYYGFVRCRSADLPIAPYLLAGCERHFGNVFHGP